MIRLILRLFGIKDFEVCRSCEILKEQLKFERDEKRQLTETLLSIIRPKEVEAAPIEVNQIAQSSALFSRRRAALEAKDREEARILKEARFVGKPDLISVTNPVITNANISTVEQLEKELGVTEGA